LLTWNPVTLPTAWQGSSGQEGSGSVEVWPRITVVCGTLAASLSATRLARSASEQASRPARSQLFLRNPAVDTPADEDLDMDAAPLVACTASNPAA
jgi:hypothetical protein